ncbi:MAG: L-threonylcarbamoyladenylate synthase [Terriglobales bacterium]
MPRILAINAQARCGDIIPELRQHLDAGGVAALPTDTLYGLAAHALCRSAIARVFAIKGRSPDKPLPLVVRDRDQASALAARLPPWFDQLAAAFWPGPLTLILPAAAHVPAELTAGSGGIAVRQPDLPFLQTLLQALDYPLTATSANRSGAPACRTAAEVAAQLGEDCPLVVDGGPSPSGRPSTIVDLCGLAPRLLREGAIAASLLAPYL